MAAKKISELPAGTANASAVVPSTNAAGTTTEKITLGAIAALGGGPPASHTHGNITNAGAIGSTANLPVITTTSGVLTTGSFGDTANTFCQGNDSRLAGAGEGTAGIVYLASVAEAVTGTDTAKAVTAQGASLSRRGSGRAKMWEIFTDFGGYQSSTVGASGGDGFLWYPLTSNATFGETGYFANSSSTDYRSGVLGITSSTSGGYASLSFAGASGASSPCPHRFDTGTTVAETLVYIPALAVATTNDYVVRFGYLVGGSAPATGTGCNWIEYNRSNSTYWQGCTYSGSTTTRTNSTEFEVATGWTRLTMSVDTYGVITFSINGTAMATTLTAIATSSYAYRTYTLGLAFNKTTTGTASVYFDYVYSRHVFNGDRT